VSRALTFAARDCALLLGTLALWWCDAALRTQPASLSRALVAVLTGLATALCGFLAHEWGHLAGARLAGAKVELSAQLYALFLFKFDVSHNGRREFLAMSYGGYAASIASLALMALLLPRDALSGLLGLTAGGLGVLATLLLELPVTLRVHRGGPLPSEGVVYVSTPPPSGSESGPAGR
jgi:hypothetical protein